MAARLSARVDPEPVAIILATACPYDGAITGCPPVPAVGADRGAAPPAAAVTGSTAGTGFEVASRKALARSCRCFFEAGISAAPKVGIGCVTAAEKASTKGGAAVDVGASEAGAGAECHALTQRATAWGRRYRRQTGKGEQDGERGARTNA